MTSPTVHGAADQSSARRTRRPVWAALLLGCAAAAAALALLVNVLFLTAAGVAVTAAFAAWVGLSPGEYVDLIDDTTAPPMPLI